VLCGSQLAGGAAVPDLKAESIGSGLACAHIPGLGRVFSQVFNFDHFLSILHFENKTG
jgi:hypothetical protein